jgi:lipoprotein-releasing system ATP-binding protein
MTEDLMQFKQVSKTYQSGDTRLLILEDLSFTISRGVSIAVTGKSGSGKSTLLNIAGGLDRPTTGSVTFLGDTLGAMNDRELSEFRNRHIGFVFQSHILLDDFSALENVYIPALIGGSKRKVAEHRAVELLERVGLADRMHHRPQKLSGGERQRVAICRALINDPDLIIADEPTGSLDEESSTGIERLLLELVQEEQKTLLLVTHDTQLARQCSTVYLLHNRTMRELA